MNPRVIAFLTVLGSVGTGVGQTVTYTRIADTSTPAPGGGAFTSFGFFPAIDGTKVAFNGAVSGTTNIYLGDGSTVSTLIAVGAANPNGGTFTSYNTNFRYDGGSLVFVGTGGTSSPGVFTTTGATVTRFADAATPIPGGTGNFSAFSAFPSFSSGTVAFTSTNGAQQGIYTSTGGATPNVTLIADKNTPVPGGLNGNFTTFGSNPSVGGSTVAFRAGFGGTALTGIYARTGAGPLTTVADTSTPVPGGTGNFIAPFFEATTSGDNVAFLGNNGSGNASGVYARINGSLQTIVDNTTLAPNGLPFTSFGSYAPISGTTLAFLGNTASNKGIYLWDGALHMLLDNSAGTFDGKTLSTGTPFFLGPDALNAAGNEVAFGVSFITPTSTGVYTATFTAVPEPSGLALAGVAVVGLLRRLRKRTVGQPR